MLYVFSNPTLPLCGATKLAHRVQTDCSCPPNTDPVSSCVDGCRFVRNQLMCVNCMDLVRGGNICECSDACNCSGNDDSITTCN